MSTFRAAFKKGFTLVELLIVVSVVLITVGVAGDLIVSIVRSYNKTKAYNEIEQNGNYALAKMTYDIRNAKSITTCSSSTLTMTDQSGNTITYNVTSSSLPYRITRSQSNISSGVILAMTNEDSTEGVNVTSATTFTCQTTAPAWVRINLTLAQAKTGLAATSSYSASNNFDTTVQVLGISQ